jgi:aminoglycoside phosphotransferase (APT) family kinase protein
VAHVENPNPRLQGAVLDHFAAKYRSRDSLRLVDFERTSGCMHVAFLCGLEWVEAGENRREELVLRLFEGVDATEDARREYALLAWLRDTEIPVPEVHMLEDRPEVAGCPFIVMERLQGRPMPFSLEDLPAYEGQHLANQFSANLAKLHSVDCVARGVELLDIPKPPYGYVDSTLSGFRQEAEYIGKNRGEGVNLEWLFQRRDVNGVLSWLQEHRDGMACDRYSLLHGDYQPANVLCDEGKITGIIDWELARIGDPMHDLGYALMLDMPGFVDRYRQHHEVFLERARYYQAYSAILLVIALLAVRRHGSDNLGLLMGFFGEPEANDEALDRTYGLLQDLTGLEIDCDPVVA